MTQSEQAELMDLIEQARHKVMTREEFDEQAISWVIGNASEGPRPTREQVIKAAFEVNG
jgi:hypothetical protein